MLQSRTESLGRSFLEIPEDVIDAANVEIGVARSDLTRFPPPSLVTDEPLEICC
jgi:hypothetical protein